jgi:hypothetical protein
MDLIDQMVAARWRQQRMWAIQKLTLDLEMYRQHEEVELPKDVTEPGRAALAFSALANNGNALALMQRHESTFARMHSRAEKQLFYLREQRKLQNEPEREPADPVDVQSKPEIQNLRNEPERPMPLPQIPHPKQETPCNTPAEGGSNEQRLL